MNIVCYDKMDYPLLRIHDSNTEGACCKNCFYKTDKKGLLVCTLDDRVKDEDLVCDHWRREP